MENRVREAFAAVEASDALKSATLCYLKVQRQKRGQRRSPAARRKTLAAVWAALALMLGAGGYASAQLPIAYVSIDVNPSVELALNCYNRVVAATAYNSDGEAVLAALPIKGKSYTEAIDLLLQSDGMQPYLTGDTALTFTVAASSGGQEAALLKGIQNSSGCRRYGGRSYQADMSLMSDAHSHGLSLGKYSAYLALSRYDDTVTAETCQGMTMAEIHALISGYEGNDACGVNDQREASPHGGGRHGHAYQGLGHNAEED